VSGRGLVSVAGVECAKLAAQRKVSAVVAACVVGPFAFAAAMRVQAAVPEDTLFGRVVKESGFATPLVVLGFSAWWVFPVLTSIVGGDLFSAEDRYGTWATVLTRSRSRAEVFSGKVLTAVGFSLIVVAILAASSVAAGLLVIGRQPLIDLSGVLLPPSEAMGRILLVWLSVLPPVFAFTSLAVLISVATRSSAAGIGLPVVAALAMQLYAYVDGPESIRRLLITSSFGAWHGLLTEPRHYWPVVHGTAVSAAYIVVSLAMAFRMLKGRDIGG
jgi:ABC-2 type transport system permease protein